jgi:hypothetical protein
MLWGSWGPPARPGYPASHAVTDTFLKLLIRLHLQALVEVVAGGGEVCTRLTTRGLWYSRCPEQSEVESRVILLYLVPFAEDVNHKLLSAMDGTRSAIKLGTTPCSPCRSVWDQPRAYIEARCHNSVDSPLRGATEVPVKAKDHREPEGQGHS